VHPELDVAPSLEVPVQLDADDRDRQFLVLPRLAAPAGARQHDDESDQGNRSRDEHAMWTRKSHATVILRLIDKILLNRFQRKETTRLAVDAAMKH
jgi:hypothetical protein